jgi:hypothetical protein
LLEIFDLAVRVYVDVVPGLFFRLALLTLVPTFVVLLSLRGFLSIGWPELWAAAIGLGMVLQGVFTVAIAQAMFDRDAGMSAVLRQFGARALPYLAVLVVSRIVLAVGMALFILFVPPFYAASKMLFVHEACLLERAPVFEATSRSSRMASGEGVVRFALFATFALVGQFGFVLAAEILLNDGLMDFVLQIGKPFGSLFDHGGSPFALLGYLASIPWLAVARFLAYVDTRTRRDGWDIQIRFMAIRNAGAEAR